MGQETKRNEIGEHTYELTTFGTKQAQRVLLRLFKVLGPAAAEILSKGGEGIGSALSLAAGAATDADLDFVTDALAGACIVHLNGQGQKGAVQVPTKLAPIYDSHFAGRLDEWALWLGWGVRENFASFFGGKAVEKLAAEFARERSGSESPST